jgi:hypothetical protein
MKDVAVLFALFLSGCVAPRHPDPPAAPVVETVFDERAPDTCKVADRSACGHVVHGQNGGAGEADCAANGFDQDEYRSDRINALLDELGNISRFSCG